MDTGSCKGNKSGKWFVIQLLVVGLCPEKVGQDLRQAPLCIKVALPT
jgi:hypothetical protein